MVDVIIALGSTAENLVKAFSEAAPLPIAKQIPVHAIDEMLFWRPSEGQLLLSTSPCPCTGPQSACRQICNWKYRRLGGFCFRCADKQINLHANNLREFVATARAIDPQIWQYHLMSGNYAAWFRETIKNYDLSQRLTSSGEMVRTPQPVADRSSTRLAAATKFASGALSYSRQPRPLRDGFKPRQRDRFRHPVGYHTASQFCWCENSQVCLSKIRGRR